MGNRFLLERKKVLIGWRIEDNRELKNINKREKEGAILGVVGTELKNFDITEYKGVDLEKLGTALVEHVIRHVGMIRYDRSGIKVFDITESEVGTLSDKVIKIVRGVGPVEGVVGYRKSILGLLNTIDSLEGVREKGSVVRSLQQVVVEELRMFAREFLFFEGLWEL